jgi:hypothetical protein
MKHYPKIKNQQREMESEPDILVSDISIIKLIDDCSTAMYREVKNLLIASTKGKLGANDSRDLREYLKLLFELREQEKGLLKGFTEEQLRKLALNNENEQE